MDPNPNPFRRRHIAVIVLGDVGRSPRMQYHARSLLEQGHYVSLVGYTGEDLIPDLNNEIYTNSKENLLNVIRFESYSPPSWLKKFKLGGKLPIGLPIYLIFRLLGLVFGLIYILWFRLSRFKNTIIPVDCILVQNPPSIPLLLLSYCYCISHTTRISSALGRRKLSRPGLVIDWHNLGYTMFDTSPNHPIKRIAKYYEKKLAPLATRNLCVTSAMKDFLTSKFNISKEKIHVLHDRPPEFFHSTSLERKHELMMKLRDEMEINCPELKEIRMRYSGDNEGEESNIFTRRIICSGKNEIIANENHPALLISSTSWTPDEDFSILLNALVDLNDKLKNNGTDDVSSFPHLIVIVTGKGPQKKMYQSKIAELKLNHVSIITMWLEAEDYPLLIGCADLGISLHVSTSGFDLPMKIYDFFGCEVPVCAVSFSCINELVKDDVNGRVFDHSSQLSNQIFELFNNKMRCEDDKLYGELKKFRDNIRNISRWRENWIENAYAMILEACPDFHGLKAKDY